MASNQVAMLQSMPTPCNATEHAPVHELRMRAAACALLSSVYLHQQKLNSTATEHAMRHV